MKAKKSLGQNFLIDSNIINKISNSINAKEEDLIIEIGPGRGALTKELKTKKSFLLCYEIDTDLMSYLEPFKDEKTNIIYTDFLNANIKEDIKECNYNKLYIVGNLPYYITTPIIKKIIDSNFDVEEIIIMVQEEVADRFSALPGSREYGEITLYLKYYFDVHKLFSVSKYCFNPVPNVESAILLLKKRNNKPNVDINKYFNLIHDSFKMKRKTLKNNLYNYDFEKVSEILKKYSLSDNVRAEELSEEIFADICNIL